MHLLDDVHVSLIESEILAPPTISTLLPACITLYVTMHMRAGPCPIPKKSGGIMGLEPIPLIYVIPIVLLHTMSKWAEQLKSFSRESAIYTRKQLQSHMHGLKPVTNIGPLQSNILFLGLAE